MDYVKKQDVALLRYTAIAPVVTGLGDAYCSNNDYYLFFASTFCRKVQNVFVGMCNYIL